MSARTIWLLVHDRTGKALQVRSVTPDGEFGLDVVADPREAEHLPSLDAARTLIEHIRTPMFPAITPECYSFADAPAEHPDKTAEYVPTRDEVIADHWERHKTLRETVGRQIPLVDGPPKPIPDPTAPRPTGYGVGSFVLLAAALLTLAAPDSAEARGRHHHRHSHARTVEPASSGTFQSFFSRLTASAAAVVHAEHYLGTNPTGHAHDWCADFMNMIERSLGRPGTGSRLALSYLGYGHRVANPQPGDIVVLHRRGGGHVGYFMNWSDRNGPVVISGNHGHRVGIGAYSPRAVVAYVRPA